MRRNPEIPSPLCLANICLVFFTGSYRNMLFMITVILNMVIGLFQEIRSKHMLDKLSLLNQTKIHVIRNNTELELSVEEVKVNDILVLYAGDEISFDGHIISGNIECNESMLTGESDAVYKQENSSLLSGSFVISGPFNICIRTAPLKRS